MAAVQHNQRAKVLYHRRRDASDGHEAALRRMARKLLGQLHYCLAHRCCYDPARAPEPIPGGEHTEAD